jgi:hypothetical protein
MKKLALALAVIGAVAFASDVAVAQGRGGGGGGGSPGGGMRGGGGSSAGGGWHGCGSGGSWSNGGWHGGGWHGGGWSNNGWRGGWRGPNVGIVVGGPGFWGWGGGWGWGGWGWGGWGWGGWAPWPTTVTASFPIVTNVSTFPVASSTFEVGASGGFLPAPQQPVVNPSNFLYYCTDPAGYFPYVQNCSRAWMQVVPQNVPGAQSAPVQP